MAEIFVILGALLKLLLLLFSNKFEKDKERKKKKEELANELHEAIKNNDTSSITSVFGKLKRL